MNITAELEANLKNAKQLIKEICEEWNEGCNPTCDSIAHDKTCKAINIAEAKKALRLRAESAEARVKELEAWLDEICIIPRHTIERFNQITIYYRGPGNWLVSIAPAKCSPALRYGEVSCTGLQHYDWVSGKTLAEAFERIEQEFI